MENNVKKVHFYCDGGHAWAKVTLKWVKKLGLENEISNFSYISKDHVFLEEDCDAPKLLNKYLEVTKGTLAVTKSYGNKRSRIRNYRRYSPDAIDWETCKVKLRGK